MQLNLPAFSIDSWFWKITIVAMLIAVREFIRAFSPKDAPASPRYKTEEHKEDTAKWLVETLDSAAIAIGLVLFVIQPFILQAFYIPSGSMENTLIEHDRLMVSRLIYRLREPEFQDVIVFKAPDDALLSSGQPQGTDFIKRCIGVPGDIIEVRDRQLYRNGEKVQEPYTKWSDAVSSGGNTVVDPNAPDALAGNIRFSYDMKIVGQAVYSRQVDGPNLKGPWTKNSIQAGNQEEINNAAPEAVPNEMYLMLGDHRNASNDSHYWGFVPRENIVGKAICVFWPPTRFGLIEKMSFNQHQEAKTN